MYSISIESISNIKRISGKKCNMYSVSQDELNSSRNAIGISCPIFIFYCEMNGMELVASKNVDHLKNKNFNQFT